MKRTTLFGMGAVLALAVSALGTGCEVKQVDEADDDGAGGETSGAGTGGSTSSGGTCGVEATDACSTCMSESCCQAYVDCEDDPDCWSCVTGTNGDTCGMNSQVHAKQTAYLECYGGACNTECIGAAGECSDAAAELNEDCGACLEQNCCEELGACYGHMGCWVDCVTEHNSEGCHEPTAHALYYALGSCVQSSCQAECSAGSSVTPVCSDIPAAPPSEGSCAVISGDVQCNPITNDGCTEAGAACDRSSAGYTCYAPPPANDKALCETCNAQVGWCAPGHTCVGGQCVAYCCTDDDCGPQGSCDASALGGGAVGICVVPEE